MKITILDGCALNPGDLSYSPLAEFGELEIYDRCPQSEAVERARDSDLILTNKVLFGEEELAQLPKLKYIGVQATGYNTIDCAAARRHGVTVTNIPAYSTMSVAQLTFAHLLNLTFHLGEHITAVRGGRWTRNPDFAYWDSTLVELAGLTMGLVGFGNIAKRVARIALDFGMEVIACRHSARTEDADVIEAMGLQSVRMVSLDEVFQQSDVVSLHCPATAETLKLVNAERLALMKPTAFLINTARGVLVDEVALADALNQGRLAGAGLDVLSSEPPSADNPLLSAQNCFCSPHFAWATLAARKRCLAVAIENVRAFLAGTPQNVVN